MNRSDLTRRQLLRRLGGSALVLGASTGAAALTWDDGTVHGQTPRRPVPPLDRAPPARANLPEIVVARGGTPEELVRAAVEGIGGIGRFVERGDSVLVKPNIGWDRAPLLAANTNPQVVAAIVELCRQAGASRVMVGDVSCNDARRSYDRSGIGAVAAAAGAEVVLPERHLFRDTDLGGEVLSSWPVFTPALECDKLINVPVAKHHTLAGYTGALKNLYGVIGGRRGRLHQGLHQSIADLGHHFRPTLAIVDAVRVMHRGGPTGGNVADTRRLDTVIASVDQVAVDVVGCGLIGRRAADVPYINQAARRGVGQLDPGSMRLSEVDLG